MLLSSIVLYYDNEKDCTNFKIKMNQKFFLKLLPVPFLLTGCQSTQSQLQPIPENVLSNLSTQWAVVEACFHSDAYSLEQSVNYREAINYSFSTWLVDQSDIDQSVNEARVALSEYQSQNDGLGTTCKDWHLPLESGLREVNNHKNQVAINQQRAHEIHKANASKPVTYSTPASTSTSNVVHCYKLEDVSLNKNIQTFNGMICPIGWLKYDGY
ncbi:hypothetical protein K6U66_22055 [Vibrio alginolyticus]|uniref:hypothetical protein n=2 Tax=Vibrio alginolyticus TaxID=663 RepID=UPI001EEB2AE4|nr:hypothetical protein [Vibrio alginolyticus]ELB2798929.1 hypothetical protein [Vibrio alginolyticus]MCG6320469.1 hypothetical protein [Vibrio alginolyticus]HCZ9279869.1 hypothetical protein [Vibrio alginolyticus]HCZ9394484.1 hypothetical protein [Vibrio alginolyticus]